MKYILISFLWLIVLFKTIVLTLINFLWNFSFSFGKVYVHKNNYKWFFFYTTDLDYSYNQYIEYKSAWHSLFNIK